MKNIIIIIGTIILGTVIVSQFILGDSNSLLKAAETVVSNGTQQIQQTFNGSINYDTGGNG